MECEKRLHYASINASLEFSCKVCLVFVLLLALVRETCNNLPIYFTDLFRAFLKIHLSEECYDGQTAESLKQHQLPSNWF